jgi:hypothetical protein
MGYAARAHAHHDSYRTLPLPVLLLVAIARRLARVCGVRGRARGGGGKSLQPGRPETVRRDRARVGSE